MNWWNLKFGPGALCNSSCVGVKGSTRAFDYEGSERLGGLTVCRADDGEA